ncbi:FAA hydrolase family protein [Palleronia sediminis]|uniref:FAA hydrolase family protein n=1 Tax=Palleronia sediminis TaxID=2547833 RepID=A0A4R6ALG0_9RHOB|nr:fumarylacetoacetate hydrolase family protein [Palleronia sediminis]TDL84182.1 FAA hydrolase family protein [Palleronia sediminis]
MKLLRYGPVGAERPGLLDAGGQVRDLSGEIADIDGTTLSPESLERLRGLDPAALPAVRDPGRIGACLGHVPNFLCIGLNYTRHAAEFGAPPPDEPIIFNKSTSCISGPHDPLVIPPGARKLDWEVELGIVIGSHAYNVSEEDALAHVAGYCVVNDVSERDFQLKHGGHWVKGKSAPGFGPLGPWLVTADEVPDPQKLALSTKVNGETMQSSNTDDMIFGVARIVSYMSRFMALLPGDLIATGTPEGVGMGHRPPRFLKPGDRIEIAIEGLGTQHQAVEAAS